MSPIVVYHICPFEVFLSSLNKICLILHPVNGCSWMLRSMIQGTNYALYYSEQELRDKTGHLADDKLSFRLIEIVYGNFEVELERNEE